LTSSYLVDVNVFVHALRQVDRHDRPSKAAAQLLLTLYDRCDEILTSLDDQERIRRFIASERRSRIDKYPGIVERILLMMEFQQGKSRSTDKKEGPRTPKEYPRKDLYLVEVLLGEGVDLISDDERLRDSVNASQECQDRGVRAHPVKRLLRELRSEGP
jgi:hypothetical protein